MDGLRQAALLHGLEVPGTQSNKRIKTQTYRSIKATVLFLQKGFQLSAFLLTSVRGQIAFLFTISFDRDHVLHKTAMMHALIEQKNPSRKKTVSLFTHPHVFPIQDKTK